MTGETFFVGIDCATDLKKVGAAFAVSGGGRPIVETLKNVSAEAVAGRLRQALATGQRVLMAFDAPLGWPAALATALAGHRAGASLALDSNLLFRRATDRWVKATIGQQPLDVGADRIARTAHAALKLLDELRRLSAAQLPLAWRPDFPEEAACIEVYPAATLRASGLPHNGYKRDAQASREQRQRIVEQLEALLEMPPACRAALIASDHALDAAVCVLAASDFLAGRARGPEDSALALKEGWIWVRSPRDGTIDMIPEQTTTRNWASGSARQMNEGPLGLTGPEAEVLRRSADVGRTHRRVRQVILFAALYAVLLAIVGPLLRPWPWLLVFSLLYILITTLEKVAYGRAVLLYKSVIQKLQRRVEELEAAATGSDGGVIGGGERSSTPPAST